MTTRGPLFTTLLAAAFLALPLLAGAQEADRGRVLLAPPGQDAPAAAASAKIDAPVPAESTTQHEINSAGQHITYRATAGTLPLTGAKGEVTANIFFTAYEVASSGKQRPITFVFNGGPGAASAYLHLGAMGPRVVPFNDGGSLALQPVRLIDNPDTWLTFTDLVFLDPVETGYSRETAGRSAASEFFGIEKDADSMQEVVRLYLSRSGRALDPVFLTGESYGGFRVALLCERLLRAGFDIRGAVLVSPALEFSLLWGDELQLLPVALALPSIAFAHFESAGTSAADVPSREELETFAVGRYLTHLAAGARDDPDIDTLLARYTGLATEEIAHHHGRVSVRGYLEAAGQAKNRIISRYDGSVSVAAPRPVGTIGPYGGDPILDYAAAALGPAFATYARNELGYRTDADYILLNEQLPSQWDFGTSAHRQGYAGALGELEAARTERPALRVLIAAGQTDLVTPFSTQKFLIDQMAPIEGAMPVELKVYRGGHMMYLRAASRAALAADAHALYADALR